MASRSVKSWLLAAAVVSTPVLLVAQNATIPPVRTLEVKPVYTEAAMRARIAGPVTVAFDVLTDGTTGNFVVVKSLDEVYGLDLQAIEAVRQWRFTPATRDGVPVTAHVTAVLQFTLRDRDGTVYGAPAPAALAPAPISAWPASFADEISEPGATWKPDSVKLGETTMHFESPAGWEVRNYPQGNMLLGMMGSQGRRMVMTGAPMKTPGPMMLPMPSGLIEDFGKRMTAIPAMHKGAFRSSGQVQIGEKWWLWIESTPDPEMLNLMAPELRDTLGSRDFSEMRLWSFATSIGTEMVQILLFDWLPNADTDRDAELRSATSTFRVILSKMSFSK